MTKVRGSRAKNGVFRSIDIDGDPVVWAGWGVTPGLEAVVVL